MLLPLSICGKADALKRPSPAFFLSIKTSCLRAGMRDIIFPSSVQTVQEKGGLARFMGDPTLKEEMIE